MNYDSKPVAYRCPYCKAQYIIYGGRPYDLVSHCMRCKKHLNPQLSYLTDNRNNPSSRWFS